MKPSSYGWLLLRPGGGHIEINMFRPLFEIYFDVFLTEFLNCFCEFKNENKATCTHGKQKLMVCQKPSYLSVEFCNFLDKHFYPRETIRKLLIIPRTFSGDPYTAESPDFCLETEKK